MQSFFQGLATRFFAKKLTRMVLDWPRVEFRPRSRTKRSRTTLTAGIDDCTPDVSYNGHEISSTKATLSYAQLMLAERHSLTVTTSGISKKRSRTYIGAVQPISDHRFLQPRFAFSCPTENRPVLGHVESTTVILEFNPAVCASADISPVSMDISKSDIAESRRRVRRIWYISKAPAV